jgi:hypothetical protein
MSERARRRRLPAAERETGYLGNRLEGPTFRELLALLQAYLSATDALQAVYNMPKMSNSHRDDTEPSKILDEEMDRLACICGEIGREAERREPVSRDDSHKKAELLVTWGIRCGEGWGTIAKIVTSALRNES